MSWYNGTLFSLLTTELNSLANVTGSALGTAFDNTPGTGVEDGGWLFGEFELVATAGSAMAAGGAVDLFIVPETDASNYSDGGTTTQPPNHYKGSFTTRASTGIRLTLSGVPLPPVEFKAFLVNRSGQAFAASANTLKMLPLKYEMA